MCSSTGKKLRVSENTQTLACFMVVGPRLGETLWFRFQTQNERVSRPLVEHTHRQTYTHTLVFLDTIVVSNKVGLEKKSFSLIKLNVITWV